MNFCPELEPLELRLCLGELLGEVSDLSSHVLVLLREVADSLLVDTITFEEVCSLGFKGLVLRLCFFSQPEILSLQYLKLALNKFIVLSHRIQQHYLASQFRHFISLILP